jgi:hypothetical protein
MALSFAGGAGAEVIKIGPQRMISLRAENHAGGGI